MYTSEIKIRVRYGETDQMGYAYYGNYAEYFEVARVEALRKLGFSYKKLEEEGKVSIDDAELAKVGLTEVGAPAGLPAAMPAPAAAAKIGGN